MISHPHVERVHVERVHAERVHAERLADRIAPVRERLAGHVLYCRIETVEDIRVFMRHHVFAVWDFMSLLKALQRAICGAGIAWVPVGDARTRRLINEIVLEEESDLVDGTVTGHFELYLKAMAQVGAETSQIRQLVDVIRMGVGVDRALDLVAVPPGAAAFVRTTFDFIGSSKPHVIAAAFTFGREDSIPRMFRSIAGVVGEHRQRTGLLSTYLERHLQLDEEDHGPKAVAMLCGLCGEDEARWDEAASAAEAALEARLRFWDSIADDLSASPQAGRDRMPASMAS